MPSYNCACDDTTTYRTLAQLRTEMLVRLGYAAQLASPPPGMVELLDSFLQGAQRILYQRPGTAGALRTERFFTWTLTAGERFYDLPANDEQTGSPACTRKLDPLKVSWVGIERDGIWLPLAAGIPPGCYTHEITGWPSRYEIRQCLEVWPAPSQTGDKLRIKGHFGLDPFTADAHKPTIDDELVLLLALANAKAHYRHPDAGNVMGQMEAHLASLVAGSHGTRRYIPSGRRRTDRPLDPEPKMV